MKRFQFRLETLLKYRRLQEQQEQVRLSRATAQLRAESEALKRLERAFVEHLEHFSRSADGRIKVETLKYCRIFADKLKEDVQAQAGRVSLAAAHREECLNALREAARSRRTVEQLKERQQAEFQAEMLCDEQKMLDELGSQTRQRDQEGGNA